MNARGDIFMNILLFVATLLILGLYISDIETVLVNAIAPSPTSGTGTDTFLIIIGASSMIMFYAIYQLTKAPDSLSFGG